MYSHTAKRILLIIGVIFIYADSLWAASKQAEVKKGNVHYSKGEFDQSIEKYQAALKKDPESDIINFNLGTALYKRGEYKEAIEHLQKSLLSDSKEIRKDAAFNLGNAAYKDAINYEDKDMDVAIQKLENLLDQYQKILELNKEDPDAKSNYEFIKKELNRLKKKEEKIAKNKGGKDGSYADKDMKSQEDSSQAPEDQAAQQKQIKQDQNAKDSMLDNDAKEELLDPDKKDSNEQSKNDSQNKSEENKTNGGDKEVEDKKATTAQKEGEQEGKKAINRDQNAENKLYEPAKAGELTDKESQMLLENYEQNEAPKGMYQMKLQRREARPVGKDW